MEITLVGIGLLIGFVLSWIMGLSGGDVFIWIFCFFKVSLYKSLYKPFYIGFTVGPIIPETVTKKFPPRFFGRRSFRFHLPGISRCPHGQFLTRNPIFRSKIKEFGV